MTDKNRVGVDDLGIDVTGGDGEAFRWLVACLLFGAQIKQEIAGEAFAVLDRDGLLTPQKLAGADWDHVVKLLDEGGYGRYDESTARELIQLGHDVRDRYDGRLSQITDGATTKKAVGERLQEFTGIGPTASRIFLREMASVWDL